MQKEALELLVTKITEYKCETQTIEAKSAHSGCPTRLFDTLSSFSNQDGGGVILFGLDEKQSFKIVGVYDAQDLQHRVAEQCKQMHPVVRPLFTVGDIDGKMIVSAEIPGTDIAERPVFYKGTGRIKGSYVRVGESDELMSEYEIYSYDAYRRRVRDDIRVTDAAEISQFDENAIAKYVEQVKEGKPNLSRLPDAEILELTGLVRGGKPTLAGVLCFLKYPQAIFPQLCVTAVVVPGTTMGDTGVDGERFLANKRIEGTISQMLEESVLFVKRNMREKTIIGADGKRHDKTEYPIMAIREAILNAMMHRDYSIYTEGAPVRIVMFKDRMEIFNEGGLYANLSIDSLGKIHAVTRNQTLANILETQKVAENRYSGIATIRREMNMHGLPEPIFENRRGTFSVTLKNQTHGGDAQNDLIDFCKTPRTRDEIARFIGRTQYYAVKNWVIPLVESGKLKMTIPNKPRSRNQTYYS